MKPATRRRLKIAAAVFGGLLLLAVVIVLLPGFQRWVALGQLHKLDPDAALERIHVTPFSAEVKGLALKTPDWAVRLDSLEADISPWSLPFKHLKVSAATVAGLAVDVTPTGEKEADEALDDTPIPGLLALTETGFKLSLDNVHAEATLTLPTLQAEAKLSGGGLAPEQTGAFSLEPLTLSLPGQEELRRVTVTGSLALDEAKRGAVDAIRWDLKMVAEGNLFDQEAVILVAGEIEDGGVPNEEADDAIIYPPENIRLTVREPDAGDTPLLSLESVLGDNARKLDARFTLAANNATLDPFALALDLPEFHGTGAGELSIDLVKLTGSSTMELDADLSQLERLSDVLVGVGQLRIKETHSLTFNDEQVVLKTFTFVASREDGSEVIDLSTSYPLTFRLLDARNAFAGLSGAWLTLAVEIPLDWFDPLLGGFELEGDSLAGKLQFSGNPLDKMVIIAPEPLRVDTASLYRHGTALLDKVSMRLTPAAQVSPKQMSFRMSDVRIQARGQDLLTSNVQAQLDLTAPEGFRAAIDGEMEAFARGLVRQEMQAQQTQDDASRFDAVRRRITAASESMGQASLKMTFKASAVPDRLQADTATVRLARLKDDVVLADAKLAAPVTAVFNEETVSFEGLDGPWLEAVLSGVPMGVPAIFVDAVELSGGDIRGAFVLGANDTPGGFKLEFTEPLTVSGLTVSQGGKQLLSGADIHTRATLNYQPGRATCHVEEFAASSADQLLLSGGLDADVALKQFQPRTIDFTLNGRAGLNGLLAQPLLQPFLIKPLQENLVASLTTQGSTDLASLKLSRLDGTLAVEKQAELARFTANGDVILSHFDLKGLPGALEALQGKGTLSAQGFPLWLPMSFVKAEPWTITSGTIDGAFDWQVAAGVAELRPQADFVVGGLDAAQAGEPMLKNITVRTRPSVKVTGQAESIELDVASLAVSADGGAPLTGDVSAIIPLEDPFPLQSLSLHLAGPVAPWFRQPAVPPNALSAGDLNASAKVSADRKASFDASLDNVAFSGKAPYVKSAYIEGNMQIDPAAGKISGIFPATLETTDGTTDARTEWTYLDDGTDKSSTVVINGKLLRVADLEYIVQAMHIQPKVATVNHAMDVPGGLTEAGTREKLAPYEQDADEHRMHRERPAAEAVAPAEDEEDREEEPPPEMINFAQLSEQAAKPQAKNPDAEPFWKDLPHTVVGFHFDEVLYRGYVRFSEVAGDATVHHDYLSLDTFSARFHDAAIEAQSRLDWNASAMPKPYKLASQAQVSDFDLSAFFGELLPNQKQRVEGLFKMKAEAEGEFPSLEQARNFLTFTLDMESTSGLFRAIPPGSGLAQSTSSTAAFFGEVLSYVPTSALGMGALSRLVSYMREVPYDLVALKIVRGTDLNIRIERMEVRSKQMLILGRGGIVYEPDVDLLNQQLDLTASMDARGEFAAIISGLGLLTDYAAGNGYWRGFEFRIWGSLAEPKTNFDNIVTQASSGTLTRNITNPFHGIWSNIKYDSKGPGAKVKVMPHEGFEQETVAAPVGEELK